MHWDVDLLEYISRMNNDIYIGLRTLMIVFCINNLEVPFIVF